MKIRQGFVSNSSSSSFIIRKSVLNEEQLTLIKTFLDKYKGQFSSDENFFNYGDEISGTLEAHNAVFEEDEKAPSSLLCELIESIEHSVPHKLRTWFDMEYEGYPELQEEGTNENKNRFR